MKMTNEDLFLEQYKMIRELLKRVVNTDDLDNVKFCEFDLTHRIKYFCKLKEKILILKGEKDDERI